jgi:sugar phosphate isomerase/epimerase
LQSSFDLRQAYATLYLRSIRNRDEHFSAIKKMGLKGEIYFEFGWDYLSAEAHRELAEVVNQELGGCGIHLPYSGLTPGESDPGGKNLDRMLSALELAELYRPSHLVAHPYYDSLRHCLDGPKFFSGLKNDDLTGPPHIPSQNFVDCSVAFWRAALQATSSVLCLENTHEHSPLAILAIVERLGDRAGMCLDIGHWFNFANGKQWDNLQTWLSLAKGHITHLHLHDNDGEADQHLGIGQGDIDYRKVFELLAEISPVPSFTLENHLLRGLEASFSYLQRTKII